MTFKYPGMTDVIFTEADKINCVVIENKKYYAEIIEDIAEQVAGLDGKAVASENGKITELSDCAELITSFFPFDLNRKNLLSKITARLEKKALSAENFEKTASLLADVEKYLEDLSVDFPCDLIYNKLSVSSIIKSAGIEIADDSASLPEKILNYMELVREFEGGKLFITVNLRSFVDDGTAQAFMESAVLHKYDLLMFENVPYPILNFEKRYTVDSDLCFF